MEDIRIFSLSYRPDGLLHAQLEHIEHDIISSYWKLYYNDVGTFEAHFPPQSGIAAVMTEEATPYLLALQGDKQAFITGKQVGAEFIIYGRTPNWLLTRRVVQKFVTADLPENPTITSITDWLLLTKGFDPADGVVVGEPAGSAVSDEVINFWRNTTNPVFDVVHDLLARDNAGHSMVYDFDTCQWRFWINKGQEIRLVISESARNAFETSYTEDLQEFYTAGWYGKEYKDMGDWDPETNKPPLANGLADNFGRYYRTSGAGSWNGITFKPYEYIVCDTPDFTWRRITASERDNLGSLWLKITKDDTRQGIFRWDCVLSSTEQSEAESELQKKKWKKELAAKTRDLRYRVDYQLGDVVRIQKETGGLRRDFSKRITGVDIWFESNNIGEQPIFDDGEDEVV